MQRFKSILVVLTEDSEADLALGRAVRLARGTGAAVTLVDVIEAAAQEAVPRDAGIAESVIARHRDRLAGFARRAGAEGVETSEAVLQGGAWVEVIKMVLREGHDIVITGADAGPGNDGVAVPLVAKCPCPVWVVTGPAGERAVRVLAAVDLAGSTVDALDRLILDLAAALAEDDGAELHVMHAAPQTGAAIEAVRAVCPQMAADRIVPRSGGPDEGVTAHVTARGIDTLVTGQAAEAILGRGGCSVLAVKPEGFVSPVTLEATG